MTRTKETPKDVDRRKDKEEKARQQEAQAANKDSMEDKDIVPDSQAQVCAHNKSICHAMHASITECM